jgi:NAD(P)H-hydrate repair Nnr-like enzyme with NAD(P)H-hydrate dehydratase domain
MLCGMIAGMISQGVGIEDSVIVSIFLQSQISCKKNKTIVEDFIELIPKTLNLIKNSN